MIDGVFLPPPKPDFANLLAVLRREIPGRPALFEFFLNDRLEERLAPLATVPDGPYRRERQVLQAYHRAGYDFTNVRLPNFDFPTGRDFTGRTVSLSGGGLIVDWPSYEAYPWPDVATADYGVFDALGGRPARRDEADRLRAGRRAGKCDRDRGLRAAVPAAGR